MKESSMKVYYNRILCDHQGLKVLALSTAAALLLCVS